MMMDVDECATSSMITTTAPALSRLLRLAMAVPTVANRRNPPRPAKSNLSTDPNSITFHTLRI
jgi:hypothetical protein